MKTTIIAMALAGLTLAAAADARAETQVNIARVGYSDLNLAHPAGQIALQRRIELAVARVCRTGEGPQPLVAARRQQACRRAARQSTQPQLARLFGNPDAKPGVLGLNLAAR
jgi:UrcA family protein